MYFDRIIDLSYDGSDAQLNIEWDGVDGGMIMDYRNDEKRKDIIPWLEKANNIQIYWFDEKPYNYDQLEKLGHFRVEYNEGTIWVLHIRQEQSSH